MTARGLAVLIAAVALAAPGVAHGAASGGHITVPDGTQTMLLGGDYGEQIGVGLAAPGDVDGDGKRDLLVGAEIARPAGAEPTAAPSGGAYVVRGGVVGTVGVTAGALPAAQGFGIVAGAGSLLEGGSVAALGDVNGDGVPDWAILGTTGTTRRAWVVYGKAGPATQLTLVAPSPVADGFTLDGPINKIAAAGDVNADGVGDILLATTTRVAVLYGRAGRTAFTLTDTLPQEEGYTITGAVPRVISTAGDFNKDGRADIVFGSTASKRSYVVYGPTTPVTEIVVSDDMPILRGFAIIFPNEALDREVDDVGDVNGDGFPDVAVAWNRSGSVQIWVVYGRASGGTVTVDNDDVTSQWRKWYYGGIFTGIVDVEGAGDVDGDGKADLVVGLPVDSGQRGYAMVLRGSTPGPIPYPDNDTGVIDPAKGYVISYVPPKNGKYLGSTVASLGDGRIAVGNPQGGGGLAGAVAIVPSALKNRGSRIRRLLALAAKFRAASFAPRTAKGTGGTKLLLRTDAKASVRMTLYRVGTDKQCSRMPFPGARLRVCLPAVQRVGKLASSAADGTRQVPFSGRVSGKRLAAGNYLAVLQAVAAGRLSEVRTVRFTIR